MERNRLEKALSEISPLVQEKHKELKELQEEYNDYCKFERAAKELLQKACIEEPKCGDFWREMFSPVCLVVVVHENQDLTICEHTKSNGENKF